MKIGFIGAGRVGTASALICILNLEIDEVVLIDILRDLAIGEAMDLSHAAVGLNKTVKISGGDDYNLIRNSELLVVSAGVARKPGMSRLDLASKNAEIIRSISKKVSKYASDAKVLVVTNPMDVMTYIMWKESGKSRREVFGMGNLLDSVRLWERLYFYGVKEIKKAWIIGEHGDSMFIPKSIVNVRGDVDWNNVLNEVRNVAAEIIKRKGATIFGPAVSIYRMVRAVVEDTREEIPTSVVLNGEYGISDVALGVPVILGRNGVEKIIEYELSYEELENLRKSASILKEQLKKLGY